MITIKRLFEILGRFRYSYLGAGALLCLSIAFRILEPKILQLSIDNVLIKTINGKTNIGNDFFISTMLNIIPDVSTNSVGVVLIFVGIIFVCVSLLRGGTMFFSSAMSSSVTEHAIKNLKDRLFTHIQKLPVSYFNRILTGELIQRCTGDVETVRKFASMQVVESMRMIFIFVLSFSMMLSIHVQYAFIAVSVVPFILISCYFFLKKEMAVWEEHEKQQDKLTSITQENITGIRVVKAFALEESEINKFTEQNSLKKDWGLKLVRINRVLWPWSDVLIFSQIAISIFAGGMFVMGGEITLGQYLAFFTYSSLVTWPMRRLAQITTEMGITKVALDRIYSILDEKEEIYDGIKKETIEGEIEFRNVSFKYNDADGYVLKNVSFKIKAGENIALIGSSGSGKTTIVSLLMRFYEPSEGEIFLDGIGLNKYSKEFLREKFGVVLQKPFLFSTTIKENIAYSNPETHIDEIVDSAVHASIHEIIEEKLPESYDTIIGERGVTLSGGQKQRLTIARTILKNPDVMIFDDSTSSVDTETEYHIQNSINSLIKNKTTIIIAYRVTSLQFCDRIIVLEKGKLIEEGSHDELYERKGYYRKIFDLQLSIEDEIKNELSETSKEKSEKRKFSNSKIEI